MEFRIVDFRLLIAELRKSAVNNRKSSFKDDRNLDWHSSGNVEELKNAPQFQTHPISKSTRWGETLSSRSLPINADFLDASQ
jgi:hypothetical protein